MKTQQRNKRRNGFSLAELMVVIVIIGLLATAVVPKLMDSLGDAKWGRAQADIKTIESALTNYAIKNGSYPDGLEILITPDVNNRTYLDRQTVPTDPWGNEYGYEPSIDGGTPRIICFGADGNPGGEKDNQDRDNIMMKNDLWK